MKPQLALSLYTLFAGSYSLPASQVLNAKFDVSVGDVSDSFKNVHEVQSIASPFLSPNATNTTAPIPKQSGLALLGFTYLGCKTDSTAARVLKEKSIWGANMTRSVCSAYCSEYQYFGLEYKTECYCGSTLANSSVTVAEADCWMSCAGDANTKCGGTNRISVYKAANYTPIAVKPATVAGYAYRGCYLDAVSSRTLKNGYFFGEDMTTAKCAGLCKNSTYFGTEYGGECYCGYTMGQAVKEVNSAECSLGCKGDKTQSCGGANRLSLYWKLP